MDATSQRVCAWAGVACMVLIVLALWPAAGFFPPTSPAASADDIAVLYRDHATGIRIATVLLLVAGACFVAFTAIISAQMRRMEPQGARVLTYLQLACGSVVTVIFMMTAVCWSVAAYRPDRSPDVTQALNDLGWFWFLMTATVPALQNTALGLAILRDRASPPVLPRWLGFFNLWVAFLFLPGLMITFFKSGPFAWSGLFGFWIPAGAFLMWFVVVGIQLLRAIDGPPSRAP